MVRNKAIALGAEAWLDALPFLLGRIEQAWNVELGPPFHDATEAFVAGATMSDGSPAVVKVPVPRAGGAAEHEATVLRLVEG